MSIAIPLYPLGAHLAEKLHAYTVPSESENSRLKDLVDVALVAKEPALMPSPTIRAVAVATAVRATFAARGTHDVPPSLPLPAQLARPLSP